MVNVNDDVSRVLSPENPEPAEHSSDTSPPPMKSHTQQMQEAINESKSTSSLPSISEIVTDKIEAYEESTGQPYISAKETQNNLSIGTISIIGVLVGVLLMSLFLETAFGGTNK